MPELNLSCSVQFSHDSLTLWPHGLQHSRLSCPSLTPGAYWNAFPLRRWCHPTISSSVFPLFSCLQSLLASGSFPMSQFFASGGQSMGVSTSASVLPVNIQEWFPLGLTGWISLQSKGLSRVLFNTTVQIIIWSLLTASKIQCWQTYKRASALVTEMGLTLAPMHSWGIHIRIWTHQRLSWLQVPQWAQAYQYCSTRNELQWPTLMARWKQCLRVNRANFQNIHSSYSAKKSANNSMLCKPIQELKGDDRE